LADDHAMIRQGLRAVLETYEDIELVGEASDGEEAESLVEKLLPAVVIMDINMPKKNGIEATAKIKSRHPELIIIGLSVDTDSGSRTAMMNAGAKILLTKEAAVEQLYGAIQEAVKK
ncbi:response regulator, partial [Nitrospira sp. BLG_2]|uniref:response regulator n=1 Tax=Nitrospira sp. BLG_2 TaxID=3397507 RepID=UPI003B99F50D